MFGGTRISGNLDMYESMNSSLAMGLVRLLVQPMPISKRIEQAHGIDLNFAILIPGICVG